MHLCARSHSPKTNANLIKSRVTLSFNQSRLETRLWRSGEGNVFGLVWSSVILSGGGGCYIIRSLYRSVNGTSTVYSIYCEQIHRNTDDILVVITTCWHVQVKQITSINRHDSLSVK